MECPKLRVTPTRDWGQWHPLLPLHIPSGPAGTPSPQLPSTGVHRATLSPAHMLVRTLGEQPVKPPQLTCVPLARTRGSLRSALTRSFQYPLRSCSDLLSLAAQAGRERRDDTGKMTWQTDDPSFRWFVLKSCATIGLLGEATKGAAFLSRPLALRCTCLQPAFPAVHTGVPAFSLGSLSVKSSYCTHSQGLPGF